MTVAPSLLLTALRTATAEAHQRIDALLQLDQAIDMGRYRAVLQGFEHFTAHWEPRVKAALPHRLQDWFLQRSRLHLLKKDLQAIQASAGFMATGDPADVIHVGSLAAAFGSMYVLEGSALGGQVIARVLAQQHGLGADNGAGYFIGWGRNTGAMWREFRERMDSELDAGTDVRVRDEACEAAVATFEALLLHFSAWPLARAA